MTSTLPSQNARSRAVLAAVLLTALGPASCGRSGENAGEGAGGGEVKVSTAVFAADCCTPGQHTACQDGQWCSGEEQCDCWGNCEVGAPPNCDDGDMCTDDACVDDVVVAYGTGVGTGHCQHVCVPGPTCICPECTVPANCDDGDACTDDACVGNMCEYGDTNCDDGDYCTDDTCNTLTGCQHAVRPDCCTTAADCDDLVTCTIDDCELSTHTCTHTLQDGYCEIAGICYADGMVNPANECESCQYLYQADRWTGLAAGTPCEDSLFCTLDQACDGDGRCVGAGSPCADDGLTCTETVCNEATDSCFSRVYDGFCLIGGTIGLGKRLRDESQADAAVPDYGLSAARLITVPLFSGLCGVAGVVVMALVPSVSTAFESGSDNVPAAPAATIASTPAADTQAPTDTAVSTVKRPAPRPDGTTMGTAGSSTRKVTLQRVFDLESNVVGLFVAAVFGLAPGLLFDRLQQQVDKFKTDLQSSQATGAHS